MENFINVNGYRERRKPGKRITSLEENFKRIQNEEIFNLSFKTAKKMIKTRYMAERYQQDFSDAASQRIEQGHLSSDEEEEMDDFSVTSVLDLKLSSQDEEIDDEILMMAQ